jgi:FkbM family methyltransferase
MEQAERMNVPGPYEFLKRIASSLPEHAQIALKRAHYRREIRLNRFRPDEPEEKILGDFISRGSWVVDVGANIGHYSKLFSDLVGPDGRVFAIEPVRQTFSILSENTLYFEHQNLTLINIAASSAFGRVGISVPMLESGMKNYYMAQLDPENTHRNVVTLPLDAIFTEFPIDLVKIDVEGHELEVLRGMRQLIHRRHPLLIVETHSQAVVEHLKELGYAVRRLEGSPNVIAEAKARSRWSSTVDAI